MALLLPAAGCLNADTAGGPGGTGARWLAAKPWPKRLSPDEARRAGSGGPLLPLFGALDALAAGKLDMPVSIIQIGDSHTAGDFLSGRLRELFQQRFGAAGRGMLPPGVADKYYRPDLVEVTQTEGWVRSRSADRSATGPFGIAGVLQQANGQQQTSGSGERMDLQATEEAGFDHAFVEVLHQPKGGHMQLLVDDRVAQQIDTAANRAAAEWIEFDTPAQRHRFAVATAGDGPVTLLSWGVQRQRPGVVYENFGTIGATVNIIGHWDPAIVAQELARRGPALIIVAFGTNEGFGGGSELDGYGERFAADVAKLADAAPQAAILIVGPPDGERHYRAAPGAAVSCGTAPAAAAAKGSRAKAATVWAVPPGLARVRAAQRETAERRGWYFWDWAAAMGGDCAMYRWAAQDPPLGGTDHVHLRAAGYRLSAERLFETLMDEYRRYRARPTS